MNEEEIKSTFVHFFINYIRNFALCWDNREGIIFTSVIVRELLMMIVVAFYGCILGYLAILVQ